MAIKTISQLDQFDNGESTANQNTSIPIGGKMHWLSGLFLTENDKNSTIADGWGDYVARQSKISDNTYWNSLFEISQPEINSLTAEGAAYFSRKIPYCDLIKNIIWDVADFLSYRHVLSDYNLSAIVDGDQIFNGTKTLNGKLYINGDLSSVNLTAINGYIANLSSDSVDIPGTLSVNQLSVISLSAFNLTGDYVHVKTELSLGENVNEIKTTNLSTMFNGWAYGLNDRDLSGNITNIHTSAGTNDSTIPADLKDTDNREGDPVCFIDGRPYELTCVNRAAGAYMLFNRDGSQISAGLGEIRHVAEIPGTAANAYSKYSAMYIHNGIISATNVIDFAEHAYWSDLGERYVADAAYEPGTLIKFGGEKEITIADNEVNAIVSTKAFDLNAGLAGGTVIALCGRVPTKVKGKIQKFDKIMLSDVPGIACKWDGISKVIGRALESNDDENVKLVECVTKFIL